MLLLNFFLVLGRETEAMEKAYYTQLTSERDERLKILLNSCIRELDCLEVSLSRKEKRGDMKMVKWVGQVP